MNFSFFTQASDNDKNKTFVKYNAKNTSFFDLACSEQRYRQETRQETEILREYEIIIIDL